MMLRHRERGGGPVDCRVGAAVWFKCLSGFRYWGHLRTSASLSVEIVIRIDEYYQSAGPDFQDGTMFCIFSSMYMNVSPKAYCGFKGQGEEPDIATGKWGCGAFNGDSQLKGKHLALRRAADSEHRMKVELFFLLRLFSRDPADGGSESQAGVGVLHLQWCGTGARSEADLQPSEGEGDHRGWVHSTRAHLWSRASSDKLMFDPQGNCLTSWRTTVLSSMHLAPSTWSCLTTSELAGIRQINFPRVCCEPRLCGNQLQSCQKAFRPSCITP